MEDAAKLEKLTRASPAEKTNSDYYFSQILGEMDALETVRSTTPKYKARYRFSDLNKIFLMIISPLFQDLQQKQSLLNLGWVFKRSDTPAIKLAQPTKNRHRQS